VANDAPRDDRAHPGLGAELGRDQERARDHRHVQVGVDGLGHFVGRRADVEHDRLVFAQHLRAGGADATLRQGHIGRALQDRRFERAALHRYRPTARASGQSLQLQQVEVTANRHLRSAKQCRELDDGGLALEPQSFRDRRPTGFRVHRTTLCYFLTSMTQDDEIF
jgi:hypothetical protein